MLRHAPAPVFGLLLIGAVAGLACQDGVGPAPTVDGGKGDEPRLASSGPAADDYEVVSLETLGGGFGHAHGINDRNVVVGVSEVDGDLRAFRWADGDAEELEGLGGTVSGAYAINDRGLIVGEAENRDGDLRAVLWTGGEVVDLGTLGGAASQALAVNERGQVAGRAQNEDGDYRAFLWWRGEMRELPLPVEDATFASAEGLDRRGDAVGTAAGTDQLALHWTAGEVRILETTCNSAIASDINERGQIVGDGVGCDVSPAVGVPLLWSGGGPARHLEPLGGLISPLSSPTKQNGGEATAINARGEIVGWSSLRPDDFEAVRATLWYGDAVVNLGGEPGFGTLRFTGAADINDRGVAAGVSAETPVLFVAGRARKAESDRILPDPARSSLADGTDRAAAAGALFGSRADEEWATSLCGPERYRSGPPTVAEILAGC